MIYIALVVMGFALGCGLMYLVLKADLKKKNEQLKNNRRFVNMLNQWLILQHSDMELSGLISRYGAKKVAIYGMGMSGRHLVRELKKSDIEIVYALDRKTLDPYQGIEVRKLTDSMPEVDAVINTVLRDGELINDAIRKFLNCPIINLEDLIFESFR